MEIAIFGGTFDPPTLAHEEIIRSVLARNDIDELWVVPSAKRKDKPCMSGDATRLAMLNAVKERSFENNEKLHISTFEMELPHATETYRTFKALKKSYPGHTFSFIFGADSYRDMPNWRDGDKLMRTMGMLLVARKGYDLPNETDKIRHLDAPLALKIATSSSDVRQAVVNNIPVDGLVSDAVMGYIRDHNLYKAVQ